MLYNLYKLSNKVDIVSTSQIKAMKKLNLPKVTQLVAKLNLNQVYIIAKLIAL